MATKAVATRRPKAKAQPKVFTVNRATWLNGGLNIVTKDGARVSAFSVSSLRNTQLGPTGMMCCLGFACNQLGVPKEALTDVGMPSEIGLYEMKIEGVFIDEVGRSTDFATYAAAINDNTQKTPKERETALKALFREHGYVLKFEGRTPKKVVLRDE